MYKRYGADPIQILEEANKGVPGFVIDALNSLLVEAMTKFSGAPRRLLIPRQLVVANLYKVGLKYGVDYSEGWLNFPLYFLDSWEVSLPSDEYGYYCFVPKGLTNQGIGP